MFCEECGKKLIRPQALYCPYCGHKVNHEPSVNPARQRALPRLLKQYLLNQTRREFLLLFQCKFLNLRLNPCRSYSQ